MAGPRLYCSGPISLFLARLIALAMASGVKCDGVDPHPADHLAERPGGVVGVVDGVVLAQPDQRGISSQQPGTEAVVGPHPDRLAGGQPLNPARISSAALLVKVRARIWPGRPPARAGGRCGG